MASLCKIFHGLVTPASAWSQVPVTIPIPLRARIFQEFIKVKAIDGKTVYLQGVCSIPTFKALCSTRIG